MTHGTTNDTTQHVAPALIGRDHTLGNQEGAGADVVGNHAQRFVAEVSRTGNLRHSLNQFLEQVDFVVRVDVLQNGRNALQTHPGINRRFAQWQHGAIRLAVELHKDDVPDLDVTVTILFRAAWRATPDVIAMIVENLAARTTRTGVTHLPEVI